MLFLSCCPFATTQPLRAAWCHCTPVWSPGQLDTELSMKCSLCTTNPLISGPASPSGWQSFPDLSSPPQVTETQKKSRKKNRKQHHLIFLRDSKYLRVTGETIFPQDKSDAKIGVTKPKKPSGILFAVSQLGIGRNCSSQERKSRKLSLCSALIQVFFGKPINPRIPFFPMLRNNSRQNLIHVRWDSQGDE